MYKTHFNKHIARLAFAMLIGTTALTSCDDYLDVRPKGEKLEDDQFKTSEGIEATIYGVYGSMQSTSLYGKDLYWGLTDIMSQDLNQNKELEGSVALSKYQYTTDNNLRSRLSNVWTAAYQTIGYANNVLKNLDKKSKDDFPLLDLYKGEMLAVRAYLHFDLLRLFCSTDPTKKGIPYTTTYEAKINDFKKVGEVYDLIIKDLQDAEQLLAEEKDAIVYPHNNEQYFKFQNYRETHCNYYAVLGILAKVYWMKGDMDNAAKYAQMVIDSNKFPLAEPTEVQDLFAGKLSDKETLWGLYSTSYIQTCQNYLYQYQSYQSYNPYTDASGATHPMPYDKVYSQDVDATVQDYRLQWFDNGNQTVNLHKVIDYYTISARGNEPDNWSKRIDGINMLHVSELYLIAAEALLDKDYSKALSYYEAETASRGIPALRANQVLTKDMIFNEYHKEMFGEGQVWYNMKRLNKDIESNVELRTIPASEDIYVLPIPQDEYNYRN